MGAVIHPFLVLRVHLKWSRASSEGILNCWKGRAKCVFQQNVFVWNFRMLWKVAFVSFHWQITWIYTPPHRITNHHRDVVRFLGVGNPKLNLKKKLLEWWIQQITVDFQRFFSAWLRNISHIPLKIAAWKRPFFLCNLANGAFLRVHPSFFWVGTWTGPIFWSRGLSPGQREA